MRSIILPRLRSARAKRQNRRRHRYSDVSAQPLVVVVTGAVAAFSTAAMVRSSPQRCFTIASGPP
jgi:hypothetical protein